MFANTFDITLTTPNGEQLQVSLRISLGSQIKLKKKYGEPTTATLFTAIDDPERLADIFTEALNWPGNQNPIRDGLELFDLMSMNGLLGMIQKERLITKLAVTSGILDERERQVMDANADAQMQGLLDAGTADAVKNP